MGEGSKSVATNPTERLTCEEGDRDVDVMHDALGPSRRQVEPQIDSHDISKCRTVLCWAFAEGDGDSVTRPILGSQEYQSISISIIASISIAIFRLRRIEIPFLDYCTEPPTL